MRIYIFDSGAYKYQKAPKYRKATKILESAYKYQKAMENIGKMMDIALCMNGSAKIRRMGREGYGGVRWVGGVGWG